MYSSNRDVFDNVSASLFGLENANAVPTGDLLRAPISVILKHLIKVTLIFHYQLVISQLQKIITTYYFPIIYIPLFVFGQVLEYPSQESVLKLPRELEELVCPFSIIANLVVERHRKGRANFYKISCILATEMSHETLNAIVLYDLSRAFYGFFLLDFIRPQYFQIFH